MDIGEILNRTLKVFGDVWGRMLGYALLQTFLGILLFVILAILIIVIIGISFAAFQGATSPTFAPTLLAGLGSRLIPVLLVAGLFFLFFIIYTLWFQGAYILTASRANLREAQNTWFGTLTESARLIWRLFLGTLLKMIMAIWPLAAILALYAVLSILINFASGPLVGLSRILRVLLSLAGIVSFFYIFYINIKLVFTEYSIVIEKAEPVQGVKRSAQITKGRWWEIFLKLLLISIVLMVGIWIIQAVLALFLGKITIIYRLLSFLVSMLAAPIATIAVVVLFDSFRAAIPATPGQLPSASQTPPPQQ